MQLALIDVGVHVCTPSEDAQACASMHACADCREPFTRIVSEDDSETRCEHCESEAYEALCRSMELAS